MLVDDWSCCNHFIASSKHAEREVERFQIVFFLNQLSLAGKEHQLVEQLLFSFLNGWDALEIKIQGQRYIGATALSVVIQKPFKWKDDRAHSHKGHVYVWHNYTSPEYLKKIHYK